jgi:putative membrane protein PagO
VVDRVKIFAAYAGCVLIWGTTWLGIKVSLASIPPIAGAGFRFIIAGLVLYAFALIRRIDLRRETPPLGVIVMLAATMFGANYALTYTAETHLSSGLVAVLFGTLPFFCFAFAHYMVGERAHRYTIIGAIVALGGVAIISLSGRERGDIFFVVAALAAAGVSGYANVYLKKFAESEPLATLPPAMLIAGVVLAVSGASFESIDHAKAFSLPSLGAIAYLALCGSAIAFYLNHWLLQRIDSGTMGLSALMIPVVAVIVGATLGHESFGLREVLGAILVVAGVGLSFIRDGATKAVRA